MPIFNKFEDIVAELKSRAPAEMQSIRQVAGFAWAWMPSERAFVTSAVQGMIIASLFAFIVLLIATQNII